MCNGSVTRSAAWVARHVLPCNLARPVMRTSPDYLALQAGIKQCYDRNVRAGIITVPLICSQVT